MVFREKVIQKKEKGSIMMWTMEKEKEIVRFIRKDDGKFYQVNINTGIIYTLNGRPSKNQRHCPPTLSKAICSLIEEEKTDSKFFLSSLQSVLKCEEIRTRVIFLGAVDKLNSLNLKYLYIDGLDLKSCFYKICEKQFSSVVKEIKKMEKKKERYTLPDVLQALNDAKNYEKFGASCPKEYFPILTCLPEVGVADSKNLSLAIYYLNQGLIEFYGGHDTWGVTDKLRKFFRMAVELNYVPQKQNFIKEYANISTAYRLFKEKENQETLKKYQPNMFNYESDKFIVIVPKTVEEFIQEGQTQHSCVGGYVNFITPNYHVAFIRRKENPEKSFITMSFKKVEGFYQCEQFLGKYNHRIRDLEELAFKEEYLTHLNALGTF